MGSRAIDTRSLSAYEQVLLFHSLLLEQEPGVRDVKAPVSYQNISGDLGQKCEIEEKVTREVSA